MGFISGTTTVTVQAKLTDAGKKKLYDSIENNSSGFITKFAIGDSDANYAAIAAGTSTLAAGHVPEGSGFKPSLRSFALYGGVYRPGVPVVLINKEYGTDNGIDVQMSIGNNKTSSILFSLTTEWPKDELFTEAYSMEMQPAGNVGLTTLQKLFAIFGPLATGEFGIRFEGGASDQELENLIGTASTGNFTTIPLKLIGRTTNAQIMYNIQLTQ